MKYIFTAAALLAATVVADKRDLCSDGSVDDGGNWYCQDVKAITYTGVGGSGSYNRITNMGTDGTCSSTPQSYSGSLAPLDEEISLHFRGPIQLKQFAAYTPSSSSKSKRSVKRSAHARRHAHAHAHGHQHHARDAAVGDVVTATIDGVVVSWTNAYSGTEATSAAVSSAAASSAPATVTSATQGSATYSASISVVEKVVASAASSAVAAVSSVVSSSDDTSSGGWSRGAYYDSASSTKDGLVFLNHNGGSGSGVFDYNFGNSLSYSSADGCEGASDSTTLGDVLIPSSGEVVIMTDSKCSGDDCGYSRPGTVAYHGFDGPSKVFLFEFQMPDSGETAASEYDAVNMPAIWFLNAQIPRTLQYGKAECSCWTSGCGEFDIFEVLAAGDKRAKSTLHAQNAGGDSDYFDRPESSPIQVALVMDNNNIHIQILDSEIDFSSTLSSDYIDDIITGASTQTNTVSLFAVTS